MNRLHHAFQSIWSDFKTM